MLFFRMLVHLLPRGLAWQVTINKMLRRYLDGLSRAPADVRDAADETWLDAFPATTREVARWENQLGVIAAGSDADRRSAIDAAWKASGGQSPRYYEDVVRAAGFDVHLYEWWVPGSMPRTKRNPLDYTDQPLIGTVQCGEPYAQCTANDAITPDPLPVDVDEVWELEPECNRWLVNEVGYLVNLNLTREAPPAIPTDSAKWPYFIYWAGDTIDTRASVPAARREEFERLILKLRPQQQWVVLNLDYV